MDNINLDIDKTRILEIVEESLGMIEDYGEEFVRKKEDIIEELSKIINTNRIASEFYLTIPTRRIPDLRLRVDPVRKKVLCKSFFKKKVHGINYMLKVL